jgi:hypothetical protein
MAVQSVLAPGRVADGVAGEKLSTEGGDDPNGNTIGCQDNKWLETLSRERIQDTRTMSVHMVILPSM